MVALTACSPGAPTTNIQQSTSTPPASNRSSNTQLDACPTSLHLPYTCISPLALRKAYGIETLKEKGYTGKGQTIVDIVSFGSPTLKADMDIFDKTFALPPVNLQIIAPLNEPEQDPHHDKEGWASETTLDVQVIHAIAPDAKIVVLVSPVAETEGTMGLPEFRQLEQYTIDHKLGYIVSHSWGASELTLTDDNGRTELKQWDDVLRKGTLEDKITYFSSSGDNGATDYSDLNGTKLATVRTTSFAASSPWTTSVGGTTLRENNGQFQETAWSNSGGGFSRIYSMPDYQKMLPSTTQAQFQGHRGVPDVAALADPGTGFPTYVNGIWGLTGGTSASAPQWAAIIAIANQMAGHPLGFINPALYKIAASAQYNQDFHDVTSGNNSNPSANVQGYSAAQGWDPITGLGTPNAELLIPTLIAQDK
jgi:subtilase family serine protease